MFLASRLWMTIILLLRLNCCLVFCFRKTFRGQKKFQTAQVKYRRYRYGQIFLRKKKTLIKNSSSLGRFPQKCALQICHQDISILSGSIEFKFDTDLRYIIFQHRCKNSVSIMVMDCLSKRKRKKHYLENR